MFVAVSLALWLSGGGDNHKLHLEAPAVASFLGSHLIHVDGWHLLAVVVVMLLAGGVLETRWGTPRFVAFYFLTALGASAVTLLTALVLDGDEKGAISCGAAAVCLGSLVAVGYHYPEHRIARSFPPMKHLSWILVFLGAAGLALLDGGGRESRLLLLPQTSGVAFALLFVRLDPWCRRLADRWKAKRERERGEKVAEIRHRVEELLGKISSKGRASLTRDEERFLRQASKLYRAE
jgi:membrane associated rhomboid family serine protease